MVTTVGGDNGDALLEEILTELVEDTSNCRVIIRISCWHFYLIIQTFLLDPEMSWVILMCCSMRLLLTVHLLYVRDLEIIPREKGRNVYGVE